MFSDSLQLMRAFGKVGFHFIAERQIFDNMKHTSFLKLSVSTKQLNIKS